MEPPGHGRVVRGRITAGRARRQRQPAQRRRQRDGHQGPEGQGLVAGGQGRHEGEEHPPGRRRSRHRLQNPRRWPDGLEV